MYIKTLFYQSSYYIMYFRLKHGTVQSSSWTGMFCFIIKDEIFGKQFRFLIWSPTIATGISSTDVQALYVYNRQSL